MRIRWVTVCIDGLCWDFPSGSPVIPRELTADAPATSKADRNGHYSRLFADASIVGAIHEATNGISDGETRAALQSGVTAAVNAMEKRGGSGKVKVSLGEHSHSK